MSLTEQVPGLAPGHLLRNLAVVVFGYVCLFYIAIPAAIGWEIQGGTDNETLQQLPGVSANGGLMTGVAAFAYGGVAMIVIMGLISVYAVATAPPADTDAAPAATPMTDGGVDVTATTTRTSTATPTAASTQAPTAAPTATSVPTATATASPTASPTPTSTPRPTPTSTPSQPGTTVTVIEIVDGDTLDIRFDNGTRDTVRLLGVDTPETHVENTPGEFEGVPNNEAGADCLGRWGDDASQHVRSELLGEEIRITFDENEPRRGYYDRLLVYIHEDGSLFNRQLIADGYGRVYSDSEFAKKQQFLNVEDEAQADTDGLWQCRNVESSTPTATPSDGGGSDGNVVIETVHADAAGDEYDNLDDEYVVLRNTGDEAVDMGGWTLADEANHVYTFPDGFTLEAGDSVRVITGSGSDTDTELYWGQDAPVWNNAGDTATIEDEDGEEKDSYQYG